MLNKLKIERAILDITQEDLAKRIGVSRQTINSIEKKQVRAFDGARLENI